MRDSPASPTARPRWTPERQCLFLHWLERTRCASTAAGHVGLSRESAYRLRARDPGGLFALLWADIMARPRVVRWGHSMSTSHYRLVPRSPSVRMDRSGSRAGMPPPSTS